MYIHFTMSVQKGSKREVYEAAFEYWNGQIEIFEKQIREGEVYLKSSQKQLDKLFQQYKMEYSSLQ